MKFAPLVKAARRRAGLTQGDLARQIGAAERAVWQVEQGGGTLKTLVPVLTVLRIAIAGLPPAADLGARIKQSRSKRGWSLQTLSQRSGVSIATIQGIERGRGRVTSLEALMFALAPGARERCRSRIDIQAADGAADLQRDTALVTSFVHGDCMEVMPTLAPGSVDLVVTSPPYNADKPYELALSLEEYTAFAERWVSHVPRLLSSSGAMWLNVGYLKLSDTETLPLTYLYYPLLKRHGLHLIQEVVWHYEGGLSYTKRYSHRTERWMWCVKDPSRYVFRLDQVRDGTLNRTTDGRNHAEGKNPTDYWYFDRVVGGKGAGKEKTLHPAQYPVTMAERVIRACSHAGGLVLDPFGGSGSTAEAAWRNRRGFISIEQDAQYHEIGQARLQRVVGTRSAAE